jgi:GDP-4-dehydro-6-deoxy-D-mannose reductase
VRNRARKLAHERRFGRAQVCDVSDAINVARAIASATPDAVIHLAGVTRPAEASAAPLAAYQSIVSAWANVLDAVRRVVPRAKVLLVSACEVYGNSGRDGKPMNETTPPDPINTFGSLKAAAESIAQAFHRNYHLDVTIARPFHYTGAGQPEQFFFGAVAKRIAEWDASTQGNTLSLPDLSCQRDMLHVQDVVEAYEHLIEDGKPNEIYNICSGSATSVRRIVETMVQASGKSIQVSEMSTDNEGQIHALCGDNSRMRQLGWQATRTLEQAIRELVRGFQPSPIPTK